jgi:hypothetical protein
MFIFEMIWESGLMLAKYTETLILDSQDLWFEDFSEIK